MKRFFSQLGILGLSISLAACGGGSSSSGGSGGTGGGSSSGQFVDGPVKGLSYQRPGNDEVFQTSATGALSYLDGETLTFSLGNITLGDVTPSTAFITPNDFGNAAIGIARFLQTLDADSNPSNGIQLNAAVRAAAEKFTGTVDFTNLEGSDLADFARSANGGPARELISAENADTHLQATLEDIKDGQIDYDGGADSDDDDVNDAIDKCPTTAGNKNFAGCPDSDALAADDDGDGIANGTDNCPATANEDQLDTDGDQRGDACDLDDDNDGLLDEDEATKNTNPTQTDTDLDGIGDGEDNCPLSANKEQIDTDLDGEGDICDQDDDNDGVRDEQDAFPLDPSEDTDTDGDGIGNNADDDDDNDGVNDDEDAFPEDDSETTDTDGDGVGNNADDDDDNDGFDDGDDAFPTDRDNWSDDDNDGRGDQQSDQCLSTPSGENVDDRGCSASQVDYASCSGNFNLDGNRSYQVVLTTHDNQQLSFQVLEPESFDCDARDQGAHPLIMHGPGYGGSRSTSGFDEYRKSQGGAGGYAVISWDPRGFGDTTGTVRGMDPDFEGQYLEQILDWAEQNLDYLAWRDEGTGKLIQRPLDATSVVNGPNLLVGAIGGSYGGGFQLALLANDHKKRLDAIIPDITWHDLRNALNPGDVVKTMWGLALSGLGEGSGNASGGGPVDDGQDPFIKETVARSLLTNEWPRKSLDWFHYRGLGYWCSANGLPSMPYPVYSQSDDQIPMADPAGSYNVPDKQANGQPGLGNSLVAPQDPSSYFTGLDVLFTHGMVDTLFDFNEVWWNQQCLSAAGATVTIQTHHSGHVLPGAQSPDKPSPGAGRCEVDTIGWFNDKLRGTETTADNTGVCFALGTEGDTVTLAAKDVLAPQYDQDAAALQRRFTRRQVTPITPVPNGPAGSVNTSGNLPVHAPLGIVGDDLILAGVPHLSVTVSSLSGVNEMGCENGRNEAGTRDGCDSITFVGLGKKAPQQPNYMLIDDQLTPIRGLGLHDVDLVGVAERLQAGDELALLFYAEHPQFASSVSRDASLPAVMISGSVDLPLYVSINGEAIPDEPTDARLSDPHTTDNDEGSPSLAGCYDDARSEDCVLAPLAGLLSAPKQEICLNGGLSSPECPLSEIVNPLADNDPSGTMVALAQMASDASACLVNADLPLCQLAASDCELDPTGAACGALAVLEVVHGLSDSLGLPLSGREPGATYCDLPAGDPDPVTDRQAWQLRDLMNVLCSMQRLTDMYLNPAFAPALVEGSARTFSYSLIEQLADPTRPRGTLGQWVPGGRTTDPYRIEQDWADAGRGRVDYISFVADDGARLVGRIFRPPAAVPGPYPSIVITTGSIQGYQEMYNWAAQGLAEAGYLVLSYDVQGQGRSETLPHQPDGNYACDSSGCEGVPFQQEYNFIQGARDAHRWLLSSDTEPYINETANSSGSNLYNPFWQDVDRSRIGHAGHSLGASAISVVGQELACDPETPRSQRDGCVSAIVGWDSLSSVSDPQTLPIKAPGLSLTAEYFFNPTPADAGSPPNPDTKLDAYKQMVASNVDSMRVGLRSSTHLEWTYVPLILPASRYGERVSMYYTEAWFDRYVRDDLQAIDRLKAYYIDGSADASSIGAGTFDPLSGSNVPYKISGDCAANRLSIYQRSAYHLTDPREDGTVHNSEDMRAKGCAPDSDGDGVPDQDDAFPNNPSESADSDNDTIGDNADPDDDNDNVADTADNCSGTAPGQTVDANGCSAEQRDSDGDGVNDQLDQCPNTHSRETADDQGCSESQLASASCSSSRNLAGGNSYQVKLTSDSGHPISFQVLEPTAIDCGNTANGAHPLVLHGHGFGGSRSTSGFDDLRGVGFAVISIDQRGFGQSGGTVRVMDPDFEGKDLVQILDWAEANLDYLAWRDESTGTFISRPANPQSVAKGDNLVVGAIGSSYGGGYQMLLHAVDEKERLDAMVPDITWHDLRYSLNPGDVLKTAWDLLLVAGGEAGSYAPGLSAGESPLARGLDPYIKETLLRGTSTNEFPRSALDWFRYHSPSYWCGLNDEPVRPYSANESPINNNLQDFQETPGSNTRSGQPPVDVLLTQGLRDTLFNFNDAWWNYQCMKQRGGDVRLLTHQSGHNLQGYVPPAVPLTFQQGAGTGNCGAINRNTATLDWLNEKLKGISNGTSLNGTDGALCLSLSDNDAVLIPDDQLLATRFGQTGIGNNALVMDNLALSSVPNGVLAQQLYNAGQTFSVLPLVSVDDANGAIVAGIPLTSLTITSPQAVNDEACGVGSVPTIRTGCDSISYVGLGVKRAGTDEWLLIDDQIMPVRGLGEHPAVEMVGIAERLNQGDEVALLVYGYHPQFLASFSRDPSIQAVNLQGSIELPIYAVNAQGQPDFGQPASAIVRRITESNSTCSNLSSGIDPQCLLTGNAAHAVNSANAAHVVRALCDYQWQSEFCQAFAISDPGYNGGESDGPLVQRVGAMHEHSGYSDGDPAMRPADYFKAGRIGHNTTDDGNGDSGVIIDFMWSSEHSDNEKLPITTAAVCAEAFAQPSADTISTFLSCANAEENDQYFKWQATLEQASAATERDANGDYIGFTALRGFEWTNDFYNHMNVYGSTNIINAKNDGSYASMDSMWDWLRTPATDGGGSDALVAFNHPGGNPSLTPFDNGHDILNTGDSANWNDLTYVADVDDNVVAMEVNGGDDLYWFDRALRNGWHIAPIAAEDEHQREWSTKNDGKTVMLTRGRKPKDHYAALKNRRTIAIHSELVDGEAGQAASYPSLSFFADNNAEEFPLGTVRAGNGSHSLHIRLQGLNRTVKVALVGREGLAAAEQLGEASAGTLFTRDITVDAPLSGEDWYFVLICSVDATTCGADRGEFSYGDLMISAPIWIKASESIADGENNYSSGITSAIAQFGQDFIAAFTALVGGDFEQSPGFLQQAFANLGNNLLALVANEPANLHAITSSPRVVLEETLTAKRDSEPLAVTGDHSLSWATAPAIGLPFPYPGGVGGEG